MNFGTPNFSAFAIIFFALSFKTLSSNPDLSHLSGFN